MPTKSKSKSKSTTKTLEVIEVEVSHQGFRRHRRFLIQGTAIPWIYKELLAMEIRFSRELVFSTRSYRTAQNIRACAEALILLAQTRATEFNCTRATTA